MTGINSPFYLKYHNGFARVRLALVLVPALPRNVTNSLLPYFLMGVYIQLLSTSLLLGKEVVFTSPNLCSQFPVHRSSISLHLPSDQSLLHVGDRHLSHLPVKQILLVSPKRFGDALIANLWLSPEGEKSCL